MTFNGRVTDNYYGFEGFLRVKIAKDFDAIIKDVGVLMSITLVSLNGIELRDCCYNHLSFRMSILLL